MDAEALEHFVKNTKVKDLRAMSQDTSKARQGYVAQANADGTAGQVRWDQASTTPEGKLNQDLSGEDRKTEQRLIAQLHEGLPEVRRREASERFRVLFERLVEQAMVSYRVLGYPVWAKSIQDKLLALGWKPKDPDVYGQCRALAERLFIEAGHKQQAKDRKRATAGWHGHYNHTVAAGRASQPAQPSTSLVTG